MPLPTPSLSEADILRPLREAIATGDGTTIRATLPEPPTFLKALFGLDEAERDAILAGVFLALETDEDRWEIIEAAAMDTVVRPERRSFIAVTPYIPANMLDDARDLVVRFPSTDIADEAHKALDARMA
jgi:hypothetical protein